MNNYDPKKHHRRSIRLEGYDYSLEGAYFLTLVVQERKELFGIIENGVMITNKAGRMVEKWWNELTCKFSSVKMGAMIVMPNHFNGIIFLVEPRNKDLRVYPDPNKKGAHTGSRLHRVSLPDIVQWFKTMTTNEYIRNVKKEGWHPFNGKLWQRNYYEHIIRNELDLKSTWDYIDANPLNWGDDNENSAVHSSRFG